MKTNVLTVLILSSLMLIGNLSLAQQVLVGEKYVQTRTIQQYLIPDTDEEIEQPVLSGHSCVVKVDNWTGHYIDIWIDSLYKGRLDPWASKQMIIGGNWTEVYCRTIGKTYQWKSSGACNEEFKLKLEAY